MAALTDGEFALTLMTLLRSDIERLEKDASWSPIVIWEAEELTRQAGALDIPRDLAQRMLALTDEALAHVRRARADEATRHASV